MITLQEQYDFYLEYYEKTGFYPHPRKLLGLLLFQEREEYSTYIANETDFYLHHEQSIMEKINKVINDFYITKELMINIVITLPYSNKEIVYDILDGRITGTFSSALSNLYRSLFNEENLTSEELFGYYFDKTEIVFKKSTIPSLNELYAFYLSEYRVTGKHPQPNELLSLLLLPEKEKYSHTNCSIEEFYLYYKKEIDKKIARVMIDFNITKEEIIKYIEKTGICYKEEEYEEDKIFAVFIEGFEVVYWTNKYHPKFTPERAHNIFSNFWEREQLLAQRIIDKPTGNNHKLKKRRIKIPTTTTGFRCKS